jgi:hypothetical protein
MRAPTKFALLLMLALLGAIPLGAQSEPLTVTGEAEVLFPEAIRFSASVDAEIDSLSGAVLVIAPAGRDELRVDVTLDSGDDESSDVMEYLWPLPEQDPPEIFTEIRYRWEIEADDGRRGEVEGALDYNDPRQTWTHAADRTGAIQIALPADLSLEGRLQDLYDLLGANLPELPVLRWVVYDDVSPQCDRSPEDDSPVVVGLQSGTSLPCRPERAEALYEAGGYMLVDLEGAGGDALLEQVVRAAYASHWAGKAVPDWFAGGLAEFYNPALKVEDLERLRRASRGGALLPLSAVDADAPTDPETSALWRAQRYSLVLYLADRLGYEGLYELARVPAADFEAALTERVGPSASVLIAWESWVFSRAAEAAYLLTPYQVPTATPLPPTATARPTETRTPSATPTPAMTLTRTATPFPTVAPSHTPTPAPPTMTPRPPGSLRTPIPDQPAQNAVVELLARAETRIILITALLALVLILLIVTIRLDRR